jgi:hypothetical protein
VYAEIDVRHALLGRLMSVKRHHAPHYEPVGGESVARPPVMSSSGLAVRARNHMARDEVIRDRRRAIVSAHCASSVYKFRLTVYGPPSMYNPVESLATSEKST